MLSLIAGVYRMRHKGRYDACEAKMRCIDIDLALVNQMDLGASAYRGLIRKKC